MADAPPPLDWTARTAVFAWLRMQPLTVSVALAARAALRVLPLVARELVADEPEKRRKIVLSTFRATAAPWIEAIGSRQGAEKQVRAAAAAAFANVATRAAFTNAAAAYPAYAAASAANAAASDYTYSAYAAAADAAAADAVSSGRAAFAADAAFAASATNPKTLAQEPLWPNERPEWAQEAWSSLRHDLLAADEGWDVWTTWYEARLRGDPVDVDLETRRVIEPTRWDEGPAAVNAEIAPIIADHAARKAAPPPPADGAAARIEALLAAPTLRAAYADFEVDAATATVRMAPMPGDLPAPADADLALDWRSRLEALALQPFDLIEHIRDARCNVPQALLKDLARYAAEAARGPDAVRPGVLDAYGRSLIAAGGIEDIVHALGDYLGGTLARIGDDHRRLMRDYHAQVTSRLHAAPLSLPEDATPAAVADAVEAVSESLKQEPWAGLTATRDVTDLLDAQKEAFRAAAARLDIAGDAAQRQAILDSIRSSELSTLATIGRLALRIRQHAGSNSPTARRVGYAASAAGLIEFFFFGGAAQALQTIMRWLGLG